MLIDDINPSVLSRGLRLLLPWLGSNLPGVLGTLWQLAKRTFRARAQEGMYEVLAYDVCLDLQDAAGTQARYSKRERVRFLQDNIIAFQDQAWGDGDFLADYQCSPGVPVDLYREGHRSRILISLRHTKNRGDIEEFRVQRTIRDGFTKDVEDLQTQIDHATAQATVTVIFPKARFPKQVMLIEQNAARTTRLDVKLRDERPQVGWQASNPRLFETYILQWEW